MVKKVRVGINGFGRIGRELTRQLAKNPDVDVALVNDPGVDPKDVKGAGYALRHDSAHGNTEVTAEDGQLKVGDEQFGFTALKDPKEIPWEQHDVDVVVDCTPLTSREFLEGHLRPSIQHVIKSSPAEVDATLVYGVNLDQLDVKSDHLLSNASCTTNCSTAVLKPMLDAFGIVSGSLESTHAATANNPSVDGMNLRKPERGRSIINNFIPTSTGAAKAIPKVIPELDGKLMASATRGPVQDGSIVTFSLVLEKAATADEVNAILKQAAEGPLKGVLGVTDEKLASEDIVGRTEAAIVQLPETQAVGQQVVIKAWYDNEAGFVAQLVRNLQHLAAKAGYDQEPAQAGAARAQNLG
jgi:glyceraldehyde 3-phosphate dehydrogenase